MGSKLINFMLFQAAWFSCVLSAVDDTPLVGLVVASGAVALHLAFVPRPRAEFTLVLGALGVGLLFDSLLLNAGWLRYPSGEWLPGFAPYWILSIWAVFATTLNVSMAWLRGRPALSMLMGGIFGPLSYQAGAQLGGLEFIDKSAAMMALAIGWAVIMPSLLALAARLDGTAAQPELAASALPEGRLQP